MRTSKKRLLPAGALVATAPLLVMLQVSAHQVGTEELVQVSGASPIAGCELDGPQSGNIFENSEVEPYVAVNPLDPDNLIATWQQDRYSNGGSQGLLTASSFDGGLSWTLNADTKSSLCTGGTAANGGDYERASDPWVVFSPDGTAYLMSLSVDDSPEGGGFGTSPNAMLAMRSTDGGVTWEDPVTLRRDESPNVLNDKNTMTADPNDSDFVYAVWDRLVSPPGEAAPPRVFENSVAFRGPVLFARTTDGGDTWEPAREIFNPGTIAQTIGNQIVVLPDNAQFDGELVDVFDMIRNSNQHKTRGFNIALIRSDDRGTTWDRQPTVVDRHFVGSVVDPDDGQPVRTGDILPEVAVDPSSGAIYLVWQDTRFGTRSSVAFSQSVDGGLTWSPTIKINQTPTDIGVGLQQAFTPMVRVASDGTIGVSYYDFRNDTTDPDFLGTDEFIAHCHPGTPAACADPANWGGELRLTDESFDMSQAPVARGFFTGDYEGLDIDGVDFLPLWSMPHDDDPSSVFIRRVTPTP
ncbi:MAG: sialidase family protein [Jiangellaceae bacterium]